MGLLNRPTQAETQAATIVGKELGADTAQPRASLNTFGDYELLEEIARGGMGVVYKARQISLNRTVAVKMILAAQFAGKQVTQRFRGEAAAAAVLQHPNIVAIHEIGMHDGQLFFSMDFVAGQNLARFVGIRPLVPKQAARYMALLAGAVHYAHQQGVLHRDLKPSNVLIDAATDQPRLTDFGLAKRLDGDSSLTVSGQLLGSPNFMPPEQAGAAHGKVSVRSDVFGLGAILYYLITARAPFQSESIEQTVHQVLHSDPVAPCLLNPSLPSDLETICLKCLEKEPNKRYQTAQELADELHCFQQNEPILARPVTRIERGWRWCRRKPALAGSFLLIVILILIVLIGSPIAALRINAARNAAEASALTAHRAQYASDMNLAHQAVQDGDFFRARQLLERHRPTLGVLPSGGPGSAGILAGAKGDDARPVGTDAGVPGKFPADRLKAELQTLPASISDLRSAPPRADLRGWEWHYLWGETHGDPHRVLLQLDKPTGPLGVLPDGKTIFVGAKDKTLRLLDLATGRELGVLRHPEAVHGAVASPDGSWLVTATRNLDNGQPIRLWDLATRTETAVLTSNYWPRATFVFSPDNRRIAFFHITGSLQVWDVEDQIDVANFPAFDPSIGTLGAAFSPNGRWLAFAENDRGTVALLDVDTMVIDQRWQPHRASVQALAFSPDGKTLASSGKDGSLKLWDLASLQERASHVGRGRWMEALAFSPDGRWLASASGSTEIWLLNAATGGRVAELRGHLRGAKQLGFTTDSRQLISTSEDGSVRVWNVPPPSRDENWLALPTDVATQWVNIGKIV